MHLQAPSRRVFLASIEKALQQGFPTECMVSAHRVQHRGQSSDAQWDVRGDRDISCGQYFFARDVQMDQAGRGN